MTGALREMRMASPGLPQTSAEGGDIYRLLYCSTISRTKSAGEVSADIDEILLYSRRANPVAGITGVLITDRRMFAQVIEGPVAAVKNLVGRIVCDTRHRALSVVSHHASDRRLFQEWSMAFIESDSPLAQETALFPTNDEQRDLLAISSFCAILRRQLET